jgi:hypothetical protein
MPSTFDQSVDITRQSLPLALVPVTASLLSGSKIARVQEAGPGGGMTFPFPTGLPTLWTYVSVPTGSGGGVGSISGPLAVGVFVPLFIVGLVVTSALEAGFLGSLNRRIDGRSIEFVASVRRFTIRIVGVNVLRAFLVFAMFPLIVIPPLAIGVMLVLIYLIYGLPFEIVVRDIGFIEALKDTVSHALNGGDYALFGVVHLIGGAVASLVLTTVVRNHGIFGILIGTAVVAIPAVFVATYGLFVFRKL